MSSYRQRNDSHGKVTTPRLSALRSKTPYDRRLYTTNDGSGSKSTPTNARPSFVGTSNVALAGNSTPLFGGSPSSFFSKVKGLLSPSKLFFGHQPQHTRPEDEQNNQVVDNETGNDYERVGDYADNTTAISTNVNFSTPAPQNVFNYPSPENAFVNSNKSSDESMSPNEKLQEFFRTVGDRKLTEIEMEGVLSLMKQNGFTSQRSPFSKLNEKEIGESSLDLTPAPTSTSNPTDNSKRNSTTELAPVKVFSTPTKSKFSTPMKSDPSSSHRYSPLFSQSRRATPYSKPAAMSNDIPRSATHYNPIPTPYRPGNRSIFRSSSRSVSRSTSRSSLSPSVSVDGDSTAMLASSSKESDNESLSFNSNTKQADSSHIKSDIGINSASSTSSDTNIATSSSSKPLSDTASALLSIIGDEEETKKESSLSSTKILDKPFINPYASPHHGTPRKMKSHTLPSSRSMSSLSSTPSSAVKELENTKPDMTPLSPSPSLSSLKLPSNLPTSQYKPTRSSHLRKSIVASPENKSPISVTPDKSIPSGTSGASGTPSRLFKFSSPSASSNATPINSIDPPSVFSSIENSSSQNSISPAKPLFPNSKDKDIGKSTGTAADMTSSTTAIATHPFSQSEQQEPKSAPFTVPATIIPLSHPSVDYRSIFSFESVDVSSKQPLHELTSAEQVLVKDLKENTFTF